MLEYTDSGGYAKIPKISVGSTKRSFFHTEVDHWQSLSDQNFAFTMKRPKPTKLTVSPFPKASAIARSMASTAQLAAAWVSPAASAPALIYQFLFVHWVFP